MERLNANIKTTYRKFWEKDESLFVNRVFSDIHFILFICKKHLTLFLTQNDASDADNKAMNTKENIISF